MLSRSAICIFFAVLAFFVASTTALVIKRTYSGEGTYYAPGLGACGKKNSASDAIVAVSHSFFDSYKGATANSNKNPICGKEIKIHYKGKSTTAKIEDRCAGCPGKDDLDMSPEVFKKLAKESVGRIYDVTWTIE
ncbi:hypothetical protein HWV62_33017 [Athelia sp. TMB]|nr:hypothetical protein HWV62_33017 [Athelia sp. TMB]